MTYLDDQMVFDDIFDAIRHTVHRCGGGKEVGKRLFPDKPDDAAGRLLMDCLNTHRPEKLDLMHLLLIMEMGHAEDCHVIMNFLATAAGYHPPVAITTVERQASLQKQYIEAVDTVRELFNQINKSEVA